MPPLDIRKSIETALAGFGHQPLAAAGRALFSTLGYTSSRFIEMTPNNAAEFSNNFGSLDAAKAMTQEWQSVDLLFQLTGAEIGNFLASSPGTWDKSIIESYVFIAIELSGHQYTRTRLAGITREINRLFTMPAVLLFRHGATVTISVIERELHRRAPDKDVLRKVTLIKDIRFADPARPHLEILNDLSLPALHDGFRFRNFVELHRAWGQKLDNTGLNKRFYQDIADWYFCARAHPGLRLPKDVDANSEEACSIFFIRLLTRLIFCWFLQERGLIPRQVFRWNQLKGYLITAFFYWTNVWQTCSVV